MAAVTYGPQVVACHAKCGYLAVPLVFGDFPAVVGSPYFLGVVPAVQATPKAAPKATATRGTKPRSSQGRVFSVNTISCIAVPKKRERRQGRRGSKPHAVVSNSGKTVLVGDIRVRLDGGEPILPRDRSVPTVATSNKFAPLQGMRQEDRDSPKGARQGQASSSTPQPPRKMRQMGIYRKPNFVPAQAETAEGGDASQAGASAPRVSVFERLSASVFTRLGAAIRPSTQKPKKRRVQQTSEEGGGMKIFTCYASGREAPGPSGIPAGALRINEPGQDDETVLRYTRNAARRLLQGQQGRQVQLDLEGGEQDEVASLHLGDQQLPADGDQAEVFLMPPTRAAFQAMTDDAKYDFIQRWQAEMANLLTERGQQAGANAPRRQVPTANQNARTRYQQGDLPDVNPRIAAVNDYTVDPVQQPRRGINSQASAAEDIVAQRRMIEKIVDDRFAQRGEGTATVDLYSVPYPVHHQFKKLPPDFPKAPKLQKFDGQGSPNEHLAYYITAMGELAFDESYLLRYFATSLTGTAFQWYSRLRPNSIVDWADLQKKFIDRFQTAERKVSLAELCSLRQRKGETALDFIKRWRDFSMRCDNPPTQEDAITICRRGLAAQISEKLLGTNIKGFDQLNAVVAEIEMFFADNPMQAPPKIKPGKERAVGKEANAVDFAPQSKGKKIMASGAPSKKVEEKPPPTSLPQRMSTPYSFKRDHTKMLFKLAQEGEKLPLPEELSIFYKEDEITIKKIEEMLKDFSCNMVSIPPPASLQSPAVTPPVATYRRRNRGKGKGRGRGKKSSPSPSEKISSPDLGKTIAFRGEKPQPAPEIEVRANSFIFDPSDEEEEEQQDIASRLSDRRATQPIPFVLSDEEEYGGWAIPNRPFNRKISESAARPAPSGSGKEETVAPEEDCLGSLFEEKPDEQPVARRVNQFGQPIKALEDTVPPLDQLRARADRKIIQHMKRFPTNITIWDAIAWSKDLRTALVKILQEPELYLGEPLGGPATASKGKEKQNADANHASQGQEEEELFTVNKDLLEAHRLSRLAESTTPGPSCPERREINYEANAIGEIINRSISLPPAYMQLLSHREEQWVERLKTFIVTHYRNDSLEKGETPKPIIFYKGDPLPHGPLEDDFGWSHTTQTAPEPVQKMDDMPEHIKKLCQGKRLHKCKIPRDGSTSTSCGTRSNSEGNPPIVQKTLGGWAMVRRRNARPTIRSTPSGSRPHLIIAPPMGDLLPSLQNHSRGRPPSFYQMGRRVKKRLKAKGSLLLIQMPQRNAESIALCLFNDLSEEPSLEIALDPYVNRTGDIWHASLENVKGYVSYGYRCCLQKMPSFDWSGDARLCLPTEKLVVYRLNVGLFTQDVSSQLPADIAGTFSGLVKKVHHLNMLGVNAVLLEPIFQFDERKGPYFPYNFFSPMNMYGPHHEGASAINSMKEMVKALHANGIEVLLEVVFTHTSEGGEAACPAVSFQGIDNLSYYLVDGDIGPGADNALNCNSPTVQKMIIDSLRYWVVEFHIDGFCFVNASYFVQCASRHHSSRPPLVEAIAFDPVLSNTKIIADCWSPLEMSYHEIDFPHWKRWAEMNSRFCKDARNFLRGEGLLSDLATRLCGSGDIFSDSRCPTFSFNFIAKNFGLPLVDLVSFSRNNLSSELSWNCGEEGPTSDTTVLETRLKQIRNFLFLLFVSLGVPVLNMGDECGQSTGGSTLHSDRHPLDWNYLGTNFGLQITQFIAFMSSLRTRRSDLFQRRVYHKVENIEWCADDQSEPKWDDPTCKFLALTLKAEKKSDSESSNKGDIYIVFNASDVQSATVLPQVSEGHAWFRLVDTALVFPEFFFSGDDPDSCHFSGSEAYKVKPHSCVLFEARTSSC
ncbi:hypothetical protein Taro_016941 [Colocasia esculenta]|uniref:Glycosyl hydrolase family 13 catalytic domain-containing protein n=1 Tax=Colocasia esculenta TaxID=4460 RepID=A0A843UQ38_COLES|nr:hypothetical protein [Colocasia esculenta]